MSGRNTRTQAANEEPVLERLASGCRDGEEHREAEEGIRQAVIGRRLRRYDAPEVQGYVLRRELATYGSLNDHN